MQEKKTDKCVFFPLNGFQNVFQSIDHTWHCSLTPVWEAASMFLFVLFFLIFDKKDIWFPSR